MKTRIKEEGVMGVSPIVSTVILIIVVFGIAATVTPWALDLVRTVSEGAGSSADEQILCQNTAYDFDTNYGTYGIDRNLSGGYSADIVQVKIINTGSVNLYNFSFELEVNTSSAIEILQLAVNESYQKTSSDPLKPGQSTILKANVTQNLYEPLREVKILNNVCKSVYVSQKL